MTIFDLHPDRVTHWARHAQELVSKRLHALAQQVRDRVEAARADQTYRLAGTGLVDLSRFLLVMLACCTLIAMLLLLVTGLVITIYAPAGQEALQAMGFPT